MANFNIDYLVIAGGGGAGAAGAAGSGSGGGGAGGLLTSIGSTTLTLNTSVAYDVIVGAGGSGAVSVVTPRYTGGDNGSDSEFSGTGITTITAIGGGGGGSGNGSGSNCNNCLPNAGGSGGGTGYGGSGALGTPGQGNSGGISASGSPYAASGGGGAGGAGSGAPNSSTGGNGGLGLTNSITVASGTGPFYAGGGGGSPSYNGTGVGGSGGSGIGGYGTSGLIGGDGSPNTGSGGGAGSPTSSGNSTGGTGSSGIVILRYTTADVSSYATTGITPTEDTTTIPGQTILSFTTVGTGTINFTAPPPPPITPFDGTKVTNPVTGFNKTSTSEGLKLPSGTNANQPSGIQGMIRNDTGETTGSSASAIEHHNGTNWQYFAATESPDPLVYSTFAAWDVGNSISYSGTGNILYNIVNNPNGFNFTKYGGVSYDSTNKSFSFNGATGSNGAYMRFSQNAMNIPTGFTVSMWVNFTAFPTSTYLFAYGYSPSLRSVLSSTQMRYWLTPGPSGNYTPYFNHGMTTGNWYNVTMVINNSNAISPTTVKTYISQEGDSTATLKQTVNTSHGAYQNTNQLYFGCNVQNYNGNFNGQLRVMEIYDSQLSQTDIDSIVVSGSQP